MLNKILKSVLLGVFALAIVTNFSSCKKEKETQDSVPLFFPGELFWGILELTRHLHQQMNTQEIRYFYAIKSF